MLLEAHSKPSGPGFMTHSKPSGPGFMTHSKQSGPGFDLRKIWGCYYLSPLYHAMAAYARWLARMLKVARFKDRIQAVAELHRFVLCTKRSGGSAHEGGGATSQLIGSTVSDAIVRSWLWSTATRSSPLGYFSRLLQVVDN